MTHTDAELAEGLRTGTLRCLHCGEQRPVDSWCTCPGDQAAADAADEAARLRRNTDALIGYVEGIDPRVVGQVLDDPADRLEQLPAGFDLTAYVPRPPRIGTPFADLVREHDRQARERFAEQLAAGRWTDAGAAGLQVRLS